MQEFRRALPGGLNQAGVLEDVAHFKQRKPVLDRAEEHSGEVLGEEFPIEEKIAKILSLLEKRPAVAWEEIFFGETKRRGIVSCFLAMLELAKLQRIFIRQEGNFAKIMIYMKEVRTDAIGDAAVN